MSDLVERVEKEIMRDNDCGVKVDGVMMLCCDERAEGKKGHRLPNNCHCRVAAIAAIAIAYKIERLRAENKPALTQWQPIETAPKDGRWILVWAPDHNVEKVGWCNKPEGGYWSPLLMDPFDSSPLYYKPTHWMPLPPPPSEEQK